MEGGGGVSRVYRDWTSDKNIKMDVKISFFEDMSDVKKDSEDISAGISIFLKSYI